MWRLLIVLSAVVLAGSAGAAPEEIALSVEPSEVTVGAVFEATVTFRLPADHDATIPGEDADFGPAEVRDFSRQQSTASNGQTEYTATWSLVLWEAGETTLQAPAIATRGPDGQVRELERPEATITVSSVLPEGAGEIRDIRGPREIPLQWYHYAIAAAPVVALLALIGGLVWWLRTRGSEEAEEDNAAEPLPPAEEALTALRELEAQDLVAEGMLKEHYVRLSWILRNYIERRWRLPALEETTGMLAYTMRGSACLDEGLITRITGLLRRADLAKFAKHCPDAATAAEDLTEVRDIVRATRPTREVSEDAAERETAAAPAG